MSNKNSKIGCLLITHFGVKAEINKTPELSDKDIFLYSQELHHSPVVEDFSKGIKNISKLKEKNNKIIGYGSPAKATTCLLYTSPSPRDGLLSRMPSSA